MRAGDSIRGQPMKVIKLHRRHVLRKNHHCTHAILVDNFDDISREIYKLMTSEDLPIWRRGTRKLVPVTTESSPWGEQTSREYRFTEWFGVRDESVLSYILLKIS